MNALIILFYRIVPFFTSIPRKTRDKHLRFYEENLVEVQDSCNEFIKSQDTLSKFPYGKGNICKNGCGPIALYNALLSLGKRNDVCDNHVFLPEIVCFLEKYGLAFFGKLGTSPFAIMKFLKLKGYSAKLIISNNRETIDVFSKSFDTFISVIYNNSRSIKYGIHIICTVKNDDGTFTSYNPSSQGETLYDTLYGCSEYKLKNVCTIGVKNK